MAALSTIEIVARTSLGESVDQRWVEWAIDALETGCDSKALAMLAGAMPPFNQFEMRDLVLRVFADLDLRLYASRPGAVLALVDQLVRSATDSPHARRLVLQEIAHLYVAEGYLSPVTPFYMLHSAAVDLQTTEVQWYWPDAHRGNIDELIREQFRSWLTERPA